MCWRRSNVALVVGCLGLLATPVLYAMAVPASGMYSFKGCQPLDVCTLSYENQRPVGMAEGIGLTTRDCINPPCPTAANTCPARARMVLAAGARTFSCPCGTDGQCSATTNEPLGFGGAITHSCPPTPCVSGPGLPCEPKTVEFFRTRGAMRFDVTQRFCVCQPT